MLVEIIKAGFKNGTAWLLGGTMAAAASIKFAIAALAAWGGQ